MKDPALPPSDLDTTTIQQFQTAIYHCTTILLMADEHARFSPRLRDGGHRREASRIRDQLVRLLSRVRSES
jgi:hypothetical protein